MCQQWLSVIGNLAEMAGFLLLAREWFHVFNLDVLQRRNRIENDYERSRAEREGRDWTDPNSSDYTMWREFQRLLNRDIQYRRRIFVGGASLVVVGAFLQIAGNWPGAIFGIKSC